MKRKLLIPVVLIAALAAMGAYSMSWFRRERRDEDHRNQKLPFHGIDLLTGTKALRRLRLARCAAQVPSKEC